MVGAMAELPRPIQHKLLGKLAQNRESENELHGPNSRPEIATARKVAQ